jgi:hypothetical protein
MLPTKFRYIWPNDFREEFLKSAKSETRNTWTPQAILVSDLSISKNL